MKKDVRYSQNNQATTNAARPTQRRAGGAKTAHYTSKPVPPAAVPAPPKPAPSPPASVTPAPTPWWFCAVIALGTIVVVLN